MGDGARSVRSAKYELPIGCFHLTTLTEETLSGEKGQRLIYNRSINIQGGKNNNLALDEFHRNAEQRQQITCEGSSNQNKHYISF